MIKMVSHALIALTLLLSIAKMNSLKYESNRLDVGTEHFDKIKGSDTKFFTVTLDSHLEDNDLLIDAKFRNRNNEFFEAPLVLVSTNPLPNTDKNSKWVCNQLGSEACFITNKHLNNSKEVYFAVFCENCDFSVLATYVKEQQLKDGESNLFHLKSGDSKVFKLNQSFLTEKSWIQVSSFNLKMTPYQMNVRIQHKENLQNVIEVPVKTNWIGGQQAMFRPRSDQVNQTNYDYFVVVKAVKDGVFNLEARTSKAVIPLEDRSIKFENLKENQRLCFSYDINENNADCDIDINSKSVRGEILLKIFPQNSELSTINIKLDSGMEVSHKLTAKFRKTQNAPSGVWLVCAESKEKEAFLTLHVYLDKNTNVVNEYKKLLYKLLKQEDMYDINDLNIKQTHKYEENAPIFRVLLENDEPKNVQPNENSSVNESNNETSINNESNNSKPAEDDSANTNKKRNDDPSNPIHINGMGVAGLGVSFLFLIPILIGCFAMMGIFVNTKFIDQPIRIKITE